MLHALDTFSTICVIILIVAVGLRTCGVPSVVYYGWEIVLTKGINVVDLQRRTAHRSSFVSRKFCDKCFIFLHCF